MRTIKIGGKAVGEDCPAFIVAEAGMNHNSDPEIAKKLIQEAAAAGADAIKFQNYSAEKLVTKTAPKYYVDTMEQWRRKDKPKGYQIKEFQLLDKLPKGTYHEMMELCEDLGIILLSTPFDEESADFLEEIGVLAFKIASADITYHSFLQYVAQKSRPIILSTGCATIGEIDEALEVIYSTGNQDVILLHCTLSYPAEISDANLNMMKTMQQVYPEIPIGLSDHTLGTLVPIIAASHGAKLIEKHYTIDKSLPDSTDHFMSVDPKELTMMVRDIRLAEASLGLSTKKPVESEKDALLYARRSVVSKVDIPKGTIITNDMIACKRPGTGIAPKLMDIVIGRKAKVDIEEDTVITFDMI